MRLFILLCALIAHTMAAATDTKSASLKAVADSTEEFSNNFFKTVAKNEKGNLITSPLSADVVLSMASYGARENTEKQMREVLKLPSDKELGKAGFQNLIDSLNNVKSVDLKLANKVFTSKDIEVKKEFKALTKDNFRSEDQQLDFSKSAESASTINKWCEDQTNNKIKDLIKPDDLDASTAMVLVNAVYFKGQWKSKFNPNNTEEKPFHIDEKTQKNVSMMYQNTKIQYGVLPEMKAKFVEIPYKGDEVSMIIILPDEINGLEEVEKKLGSMSLSQIRKQGYPQEVELYLPKFKIESTIQLNNVLTEMGMGEMFTDKANFKGISEIPLKVSKVVQKAFIEVNEEGAEAAAATGMIMMTMSLPMIFEFRVDHPFHFQIVKRMSGREGISLFTGNCKNIE